MSYIGKTPTVGNFQVCDAISVVNNQAAYTMQVGSVNVSPESANHMIVSLNGVIQKPTDAYTVSSSTITFASNLVTGDVINFIQILGNVLDLGVPSDSTVSLAKLTATGTKNSTTFLRGDNTFNAPSVASLSTASGSAPSYSARSWVNFNGTGTVAIRDSGNVSSITDQGVGNYTVNFATNMPDVNYASVCSNGYIVSTGSQQFMFTVTAEDTHAVGTYNVSNRLVDNDAPTMAAADSTGVMVSIFR